MKKYIILLGILIAAIALAFGQDKVYLKNGSVLKGKYIQSDSITLKIELEGAEFIVPWSIVSGIKMGNKNNFRFKSPIEKKSGIAYGVKMGALVSSSSSDFPITSSYEFTMGYHWNQWLTALGKTSIDINGEYLSMPVGIRVLSSFGNSNIKPVIMGDIGYGWSWERKILNDSRDNSINGGMHYAAGLGLSFLTRSGMFMFSVMGKSQTINITYSMIDSWRYNPYNLITERKRDMRRIELGISYMFY